MDFSKFLTQVKSLNSLLNVLNSDDALAETVSDDALAETISNTVISDIDC